MKRPVISYEGVDVAYDPSQLERWSVVKALSSPTTMFGALDAILCGRSDEVAEALGDSMEAMEGLLERIVAASGAAAKN